MSTGMLEYLKGLVARFDRTRLGRLPPEPPGDPYASVREPRKSGPGGRNLAAEIEEPRDEIHEYVAPPRT